MRKRLFFDSASKSEKGRLPLRKLRRLAQHLSELQRRLCAGASLDREQRHALANSLLVEYANTPDQWSGGAAGGIIANIDAMVSATRLSDSAQGSWNDADMLVSRSSRGFPSAFLC